MAGPLPLSGGITGHCIYIFAERPLTRYMWAVGESLLMGKADESVPLTRLIQRFLSSLSVSLTTRVVLQRVTHQMS